MRPRLVLPLAVLLSLGLGTLVLLSQAWHRARVEEQRQEHSLAERLRREDLSTQEKVDGLVAVLAARDYEEAKRLRRLVPPPANDPELSRRVVSELQGWFDEERAHSPLRPERIEFLCQFLELWDKAELARSYRDYYDLQVGEFHRMVARFVKVAGTLEPYRGMADDAGILDRIVQAFAGLRAAAREEGFDPWDDPVFREGMEVARRHVWDYAVELLRLYEEGLAPLDERDLPERQEWIRRINLEHPRHHLQLVKAARVLSLLAWESGADDAAAERLLVQVANDVSGGAGLVAVLLILFFLPLCVLALALREVVIGPAPVDPSADTLERVDPVDLDTEGVTVDPVYSTTHGGTSMGFTTRIGSSASGTAVAADLSDLDEGIDDETTADRRAVPPGLSLGEDADEDG